MKQNAGKTPGKRPVKRAGKKAGKKRAPGCAAWVLIALIPVFGVGALVAFQPVNMPAFIDTFHLWDKNGTLFKTQGTPDALAVPTEPDSPDTVEPDQPSDEPVDAATEPADVIDVVDVPDSGKAADTADHDDGHWRDRRREEWEDPCWTKEASYGKKPSAENDARRFINLCDGDMPFPESVGFKFDKSSGGVGTLPLKGGSWDCLEKIPPDAKRLQEEEDEEYWNCGGLNVSDVAYVDFDRDGKREAVVFFMSNFGGNCEIFQVYSYEITEKRPRFKAIMADSGNFSCDSRGLDSIEPFGRHCIKALINCDKTCHGCDGIPCYDVYAWTGKQFKIVESWTDKSPNPGTEPGTRTEPDMKQLCGIP